MLRSAACSIGDSCESFGIVVNRLGLCSDRCESFVGCELLRIVWVCAQIVANQSYRQRFKWIIGDGSGGLSVTVTNDSLWVYRRQIGFLSAWFLLGWVLLGTKVNYAD